MQDLDYLAMAVQKASQGVAGGQDPYGATIVRDGTILSCEHNLVNATCDPSAHAEVVAIRKASVNINDTKLTGATIYCTCEPCVMCFGACYWAGISTIVYGADIDDKASFGLVDPGARCVSMNQSCGSPMVVKPRLAPEACVDLFRQYLQRQREAT